MQIDLKGIHKTFGAVHANDGIDLSIPSGCIQGILGENGAGKSTLMKILSGYIQADRGEIFLDGTRVDIRSPNDANHMGVGMLHQDPLDVPPMRVLENLLVGGPGGLFPQRTAAREALLSLSDQFGFSLDPEAYVETLTVGERQQLELLRLLWLGARLLILDEPTTGISALQKEKLFATLRRLCEQGMTVIFVSHKLEEVEGLCHRVAVLRRGRLVGEASPPYSTDRLVEMMFGKAITLGRKEAIGAVGQALELDDVVLEDRRMVVGQVDVEVSAGEVIGLAGMEGSGQQLLLRACAGLARPVHGRVRIAGKDLTGRGYHAFLRHGIAYVPAARLEEGLIPGLTLAEHFALTGGAKGVFIDREAISTLGRARIADFSIRGTPLSPVEDLSGGNQQRALLALMKPEVSLLLLEHPTRGLDVESVIYIWGKLKERCRQKAAIVFISSDLEELLHYSDRILVFFGGRVSPPLPAEGMNVDDLGQLIGGKGWESFA
ncbi:MAG TPA: ATP-binding cassette domain-containing protein [Anaerolineales bacterium]|nr:ATP-binding cassette domain-containing protein [Anaerolineales bacterium]